MCNGPHQLCAPPASCNLCCTVCTPPVSKVQVKKAKAVPKKKSLGLLAGILSRVTVPTFISRKPAYRKKRTDTRAPPNASGYRRPSYVKKHIGKRPSDSDIEDDYVVKKIGIEQDDNPSRDFLKVPEQRYNIWGQTI